MHAHTHTHTHTRFLADDRAGRRFGGGEQPADQDDAEFPSSNGPCVRPCSARTENAIPFVVLRGASRVSTTRTVSAQEKKGGNADVRPSKCVVFPRCYIIYNGRV